METMVSQNQVFYGSLLCAISLIWAMSLLYKDERKKTNETYWMVIMLALPFLGSVAYLVKHYISGKKGKYAIS